MIKYASVILDFVEGTMAAILQTALKIIDILKVITQIIFAIAPIVWEMLKGIVSGIVDIMRTIICIVGRQSKAQ